jgi:hypothetical protein
MLRLLAILAMALVAGCSASGRIADSATAIRAHAESSRTRFDRIGASADAGSLNAREVGRDAKAGAHEQGEIIAATDAVVQALPGIRDLEPWWAKVVVWVMAALSVLGVALLLWMTGVGAFVKRALAGLGLMIPARVQSEASLAADVMDKAEPAQVRELVAAMRAADPVFDQAFRRAKQAKRAKAGTKSKRRTP